MNGFVGDNGQLNDGAGTRSSRGSLKKDNNENKAIVSRVSFSPMLGAEIAGSVHHGKWDSKDKYDLTLFAVDGALQRGPFELMGEAAWGNAEGPKYTVVNEGTTVFSTDDDDSFRRRTPLKGDKTFILPENMFGYYVQLNYHFMPQGLTRALPSYFRPGLDVLRASFVTEGADANTNSDTNNSTDEERLTLGLNFRPVEDSVIKFAYTWNRRGREQSYGSHESQRVPVQLVVVFLTERPPHPPLPSEGRGGEEIMSRQILLSLLLVVSMVGCAAVSGAPSTVKAACSYDQAWSVALSSMDEFVLTQEDKNKGVIETDWATFASERSIGVFQRQGNKERARFFVNVEAARQPVTISVRQAREFFFSRGRAVARHSLETHSSQRRGRTASGPTHYQSTAE